MQLLQACEMQVVLEPGYISLFCGETMLFHHLLWLMQMFVLDQSSVHDT